MANYILHGIQNMGFYFTMQNNAQKAKGLQEIKYAMTTI